MIEDLRMAELLCARLCHDLTGPIGAVNNGAEFLSEEGFNMQGEALELITSSAFSAVTRLQFYRLAYGVVKERGEANLSDHQKLAQDFFADSKITLDWPDSHTEASNVSISLKMSRLIFNLLIMASATLIRGGTMALRVGQEADGSKWATIDAQGPGLKWDTANDKILAGGLTVADLDTKNVQAYLTKKFADDLSGQISYTTGVDTVQLKLSIAAGAFN